MLRSIYKNWQDERMLRAFLRGDEYAFNELYLRHKQALFRFLVRQSGNTSQAEEICQDTWLTVISQAGRFDFEQKFTTWLFTIARRKQIDAWRKHQTQRNALGRPVIDYLNEIEDSSTNDVSQQLVLKELIHRLKSLSPVQMEALLLKVEGFSHSEIAQITNAKRETVKSRLRYANKSLRAAIQA